ncbi:FadR/GntR family transcriptional regulator [Rubellimicrobium rubrum]|uniref:FadR/GntR family transcriptional regulator n=1 Tax=Rubellimicrobium rubrum TaxID=2585369 RepID=UPI001FE90F31|nr:FadR/GntR family transcriptional regulator [Rubellimicrobium rubrum]
MQNLILEGTWKPGQKIPSQRTLSEDYDISRASLREALLTLETLGLIRSEPGRGTFVTHGQEGTRSKEGRWRYADSLPLRDVFQTRIMLESEIAALAAQGIDDGSLDRLEAATEEMQRGWDLGDLVTNVEADLLFHQIIVGHCGNRMLQLLYENAAEILTETQRQPIPATRTERMQASIAEHREVIAALRARDPEGARAAMATHIRNTALSAAVDLD